MQGLDVGRDQFVLALELLADELFDFRDVHVKQCRQCPDINNVLEQLALARIGILLIADFGQRQADDMNVFSELRFGQRLGRVVEQVSAGLYTQQVFIPGLRIHRHHQIHSSARAQVSRFGNPHFVPGRQALNI